MSLTIHKLSVETGLSPADTLALLRECGFVSADTIDYHATVNSIYVAEFYKVYPKRYPNSEIPGEGRRKILGATLSDILPDVDRQPRDLGREWTGGRAKRKSTDPHNPDWSARL